MFRFLLSWCDIYLCLDDSDEQNIYDQRQKIKLIIVNCCITVVICINSNYINIKYVGSTIKYFGFKSIHYTINLNVDSSFMVFSDFDSMFLSMYYLFESMKLFFS